MDGLPVISITAIALAFLPAAGVLYIMWRWSLGPGQAGWANVRMLVQLLAVGYVLTFIFEATSPWVVGVVITVMMGVAAWIAERPLESPKTLRSYLMFLTTIGSAGLLVLVLVTQFVLDLPRWFEPRFVVPIAGMIFANSMNTTSLAAERLESELEREVGFLDARQAAMRAAMIPQVNALLAVGLVSLPGMMTGQILSGVEPLVAVRYQIIVMCMLFGSSGLSAAGYLTLVGRFQQGSGHRADVGGNVMPGPDSS
jgi:putative ABC transport system permease protein